MMALGNMPEKSGRRSSDPAKREPRRMAAPLARRLLLRLVEVAAVSAVYYAAARVGLLLQLPGTNASAVWPPSGIGFAAVLLLGLRAWPGIALGAFLANLLTLPGTPAGLVAASTICIGNTLEHVVGFLLIRRFVKSSSPFDRSRDVIWFVVTAAFSCAVASTNGVSSLWLVGILPSELYGPAWLTWWLGDTAGMLVLTPAVYCWWRSPRLGFSAPRALELAVLIGLTILTAELLFGGWIDAPIASLPFLFVVPWLLWAALRFGPRETSSLTVILSVIAVGHTWWTMGVIQSHSAGQAVTVPFLSPALGANDSLLVLQFFLCAMVMTGVLLAAAVNERRVAEQSLTDSERRFRTIFEQAAVGAALIETPTGRFVRINQRYCDLIGYSVEEVTLKTFREITHPDDLAKDLHNMRRLVAGEIREFTMEKRYLRKDGSVVWVNLTVSPSWRAGEEAEYHIAIVEDISDRKRAQDALRESEERLRLAQQAAHIGAFEWNIKTGVNTWTPELEAMHGLARGEFGRTQPAWEQMVHPDDRVHAVQCVDQAFSTGLPTEGEWRVVWPDRSVRWLAGRFQLFNDETGNPLRLSGINIDITERKRAEERLKATLHQLHGLTAHLESVREEERTRIARELHDELGQSLTGLKLELAWMKGRLAKENDRVRLSILLDKTDEMSELIDTTIQAMRRIVAELRPAILDEFGLAAALEWQGQEFQKRTGIRCTVTVSDTALDRHACSALFRIVQEALTNVARHAGATAVDIRLNEDPQGIMLVVEDNGRGLQNETVSPQPTFGMLGMRERAAAAGGTFQVESGIQPGTRLVVQLPLPPPETSIPPIRPRRAETVR